MKRAVTLVLVALATPPAALAQGAAPAQPGQPQTTINIFPPGTQPPVAPQAAAPQGAPAASAGTQTAAVTAPTGARATTGTIRGAYNQGETRVRMEVVSLTRESNTLMLRVRAVNEGGVDANMVYMQSALTDAYIVDPSSQRRAGVLKTPSGDALATDMAAAGVPAGQERELFAQFPAPPPNVGTVNLYLQGFGPIMGVPIT